jgi:hypothetical protein
LVEIRNGLRLVFYENKTNPRGFIYKLLPTGVAELVSELGLS